MEFTVYKKSTGEVLYGGTTSSVDGYETPENAVLLGSVFTNGYLVDGIHYSRPSQPSPHYIFNYATKQWEDPRTLQDIKAAQWALIKQARSQAEYAGFTWGSSTFDSDATSQNRITGAVTLAQLSPAFTIDWTLQNNTVRTLSQADMIAVGVALGTHVQTQFAKGQALRAQIDAATTQAEVEAVVW